MNTQVTNFFITGSKNVGKSYLIRELLHTYWFNIGGFLTLPKYDMGVRKGFYYHSLVPTQEKNDQYVAIDVANKLEIKEKVFITLGIECLKESLAQKKDIIIMDELGRFEQRSNPYILMVNKILDSNACVLGVIKKEQVEYLECIKRRFDTYVYDLDNMDLSEILKLMKQYLKEIYDEKK